ncbi:SGNH/GDSL hydrolase family protein [Fictibacillus sp. BK138]|uniref:SGNH/GDSL hydrolase family protein n=1 Tax=Fictibacillus sp. BK138 TaxID=2512121 RepID=UPI0010298924|nr:SGNH/GDSL hydrolase family protein [Fictibacillus sp. BK138]RZT23524.1 lysophospholipase L1-like esterase [Fictibacillus sp. BK138]
MKMGINEQKSVSAVQQPLSKWKDKVWLTLGDSITAADQTMDNGSIVRGYQSVMHEKMGFKEYRNSGQFGSTISGNDPDSTNVFGKEQKIDDVDVITIFAGTNDFRIDVPIGSLGLIGDTTLDTSTFYGAYRSLIEDLLTSKPTLKIYLWTPLQRDNAGYDVNFSNLAGHKLIDYVNAVKEIGQMYAIPVLDLYSLSGITKLNLDVYTYDGLHPSDNGYERIADVARGFMEIY